MEEVGRRGDEGDGVCRGVRIYKNKLVSMNDILMICFGFHTHI